MILSWVQAEGEKEGGKERRRGREMEAEKRRGREVEGEEKGKGRQRDIDRILSFMLSRSPAYSAMLPIFPHSG